MKKQVWFQIICIICCFIPLLFGMIWLSITIIISFIYILLLKNLSKVNFRRKKSVKVLLVGTGILVFSITLRLFAMEIYAIPSPSMENTILAGDKVLVNKLKYGPKGPKSPFEIPWLNLFFYFNKAYGGTADSIDWGYNRFAGYGEIERGDILVFNHPQLNQAFIKRCVGLPGDTIEIRNGYLFVNGKLIHESLSMKMPYHIIVDPNDTLRKTLNGLKIFSRWTSPNRFDADLTKSQVDQFAELSEVYFLKPVAQNKGFNQFTFPYKDDHYHTGWSIDNYGPYVVPKSGMEIELNIKSFHHYHTLIQERDIDGVQLKNHHGKYYLGENEIKSYVFSKDFYFFMGDNRHNSNDSRYWGPVQEDNIIGVASTIIFSNPNNKFLWSRFFKSIN